MSWNPYFQTRQSTKHRLFVSFNHQDQDYRDEFDRRFGHLFTSTSVKSGEVDDSNSTEYIKQLIRKDFISAASVVVVLMGPETYCRKHVDWEIYAGLDKKAKGLSGLLGIWLPNHPDFPRDKYNKELVPPRLLDNVESGYANMYNWTEDPVRMNTRIEHAFQDRIDKAGKVDNSRLQFKKNHC